MPSNYYYFPVNLLRPRDTCVRSKLTINGSDNGLSFWDIVYWTRMNKLQWNLYRNSLIFIQENAFGNVAINWLYFCSGTKVLTDYPLLMQ